MAYLCGLSPATVRFCPSREQLRVKRDIHPRPPVTLGVAAAAQLRLIVWCKECHHQVEPDPAEMAQRSGANTSVLDWRRRLVCSKCVAAKSISW